MQATTKHVTHAEMLAAAGVGQVALRRWVTRGLLPAPIRTGRGRARGSFNLWPLEALERVRWIREQRDAGVSIDELLERLQGGQTKVTL